MNQIAVRFALSTYQSDSSGLLYCKEIRSLVADEASRILSEALPRLYGGYVYVVDDRVWNSYEQVRFDPGHIRLPADTLTFAALMLDDLVAKIDDRPTISIMLSEMASMHIEFISSGEVTISGTNHEGGIIYPKRMVRFDHLLREVLSGTEDFLRFAKEALDRQSLAPNGLKLENSKFLERWGAATERLKRCM